jgi:hypothetical protein
LPREPRDEPATGAALGDTAVIGQINLEKKGGSADFQRWKPLPRFTDPNPW